MYFFFHSHQRLNRPEGLLALLCQLPTLKDMDFYGRQLSLAWWTLNEAVLPGRTVDRGMIRSLPRASSPTAPFALKTVGSNGHTARR
jgi:hypothetical protein